MQVLFAQNSLGCDSISNNISFLLVKGKNFSHGIFNLFSGGRGREE
jgi:hypothetical protein